MLVDAANSGDATKTKVMPERPHALSLTQVFQMFGILSSVDYPCVNIAANFVQQQHKQLLWLNQIEDCRCKPFKIQ